MSAIQLREPVCYDVLEVGSGRYLGAGKFFADGNLTDEDVLLVEQAAWSEHNECYLIRIPYEQYERSFGRTPDLERDWAEHHFANSAAGLREALGL